MNNIRIKIKYTVTVLILAFVLEQASYQLGRLFSQGRQHIDMTLPLDLVIPCIPFTVVFYFGCFLTWLTFYIIIIYPFCFNNSGAMTSDGSFPVALEDTHSVVSGMSRTFTTESYTPEKFFSTNNIGRFLTADVLAKSICFAFFIIIPTTAVRPEITGDSVWDALMVFLYRIDPADNLFPSFHCLISWMCWIGMRQREDLRPVLRHLPLPLALIVCISTLTTKQHVLLDVFGGIFIAELCWWLAGFSRVRKQCEIPLAWFLKALFKQT